MSRSFRDRVKIVRRFLLYLALRPGIEAFRVLPPARSAALGANLAAAARFLFLREAARGLGNIRRALPDLTEAEARRVLARQFRHLGWSLGEYLSMTRRDPRLLEERVRVEGIGAMNDAVARGRGAVVLTAHLGNWELAVAAMAAKIPRLAVVARELYDINLSRFVEGLRARFGVATFDNRDNIGVFRHLKRGGVLATLVDQESRKVANVPAPIFGIPALAPAGPVVLASRAGAALFSGFTYLAGGVHQVDLSPMAEAKEGTPPEQYLAEFNRRLERMVRATPEQWVWLHGRWRAGEAAA